MKTFLHCYTIFVACLILVVLIESQDLLLHLLGLGISGGLLGYVIGDLTK